MASYAIIDSSNTVCNVIEYDSTTDTWTPDSGHTVQPLTDGAGIGWTFVSGAFVAPPYVPPVVDDATITAQILELQMQQAAPIRDVTLGITTVGADNLTPFQRLQGISTQIDALKAQLSEVPVWLLQS